MNSLIAQTLSQNQTLHEYVAYNWSYGHFCDFCPIFAKSWLPWQRPLHPWNQKCLLWIGRPQNPPVISNCILVVFHTIAFICIYSYFSPKIGCHGNAPLSLVNGSVTDEFPDSTNPIAKPNSAWICCIQLKLCPFLWFFGLFWPKFGCHCNALRPLESEMSSLDWSTTKLPVISNRILVISRRNAFICICSSFCPKVGCHGNAPLSLV